jgi:hypothetical protein
MTHKVREIKYLRTLNLPVLVNIKVTIERGSMGNVASPDILFRRVPGHLGATKSGQVNTAQINNKTQTLLVLEQP